MARRVSLLGWVVVVAVAMGASLFVASRLSFVQELFGTGHPSIFLVTIDTLRADHCSLYGYARPTTPRLDALGERGVRFDAAYAPMATTAPSHATMFTSLLPRAHGVLKNGQFLAAGHRRVAEILRESGYNTAAFVSSFAVNRRFGFTGGFATYSDVTLDRRADETRARSLEWLRANGYLEGGTARAPFFLWVHLIDPHEPYDPPPDVRAQIEAGPPGDALQQAIANYDAEIRFADREMGAIIDALTAAGRFDRTLTIVLADHGEGLMQHQHMGHGLFLYEEAVRVPFVVHWPYGLPKPHVVAAPVQVVDLAPTILELAGLAPEPRFQGTSLSRALRGDATAEPERPVFLERREYDTSVVDGFRVAGQKFGLRVGRWKYIESRAEETRELFDLTADPGERSNLAATQPGQADELARVLRAWSDGPGPAVAPPVSPEDAERLRQLGYVP